MPAKEHLPYGKEAIHPLLRIPSREFTKIYDEGRMACEKVFRAHNPEAKFGPETADEFVRMRFQNAPPFHQNMSSAIFTIWQEIHKAGGFVDDEHTWRPIQEAAIWDTARAICEKSEGAYKTSFLTEAAAGAGKLFPLAVYAEAASRLQRMGTMEGSILFATYRKGLLGQQLLEPRRRLQQLLSAPPFGEKQPPHANDFLSYLHEKIGAQGHLLFPPRIGNALFTSPAKNSEEAKIRVLASLQNRTNADGVPLAEIFASLPNSDEILSEFAALLTGRLTVLASQNPEKKWEPLELSEAAEKTENSSPFHMGRAIPQTYIDDDLICTREGWSMGVEPYFPGYESEERENQFRFVILPITLLEQERIRKKYERVLSSVEVAILDEDFHAGNWIQELIMQARSSHPAKDGKKKNFPLVFGAKAAHNDVRQFHSHYTPVYPIEQYVNDGIGPPIAPVIFPHAKEVHHFANTEAATRQMVDSHFADLPFLSACKSPQAYEMRRKLFLLDEDQIPLCTELLQKGYEERNSSTRVIPLTPHSPNYKDAHRFLRVLARMSDAQSGPTDIVTTPRIVSHSYDWQELGVVTVGTPLRKKNILFLLERLLHSILHESHDKGFRTLFKHQMFADASSEHFQETLFWLLKHKFHMKQVPGTFFWVPGQALLSDAMFDADKRRQSRGKHEQHPYIQWVKSGDEPPVKKGEQPKAANEEKNDVAKRLSSPPPPKIQENPHRHRLFSTWEETGFDRAWARNYAEKGGVPHLEDTIYAMMNSGEGNGSARLSAVRKFVEEAKMGNLPKETSSANHGNGKKKAKKKGGTLAIRIPKKSNAQEDMSDAVEEPERDKRRKEIAEIKRQIAEELKDDDEE